MSKIIDTGQDPPGLLAQVLQTIQSIRDRHDQLCHRRRKKQIDTLVDLVSQMGVLLSHRYLDPSGGSQMSISFEQSAQLESILSLLRSVDRDLASYISSRTWRRFIKPRNTAQWAERFVSELEVKMKAFTSNHGVFATKRPTVRRSPPSLDKLIPLPTSSNSPPGKRLEQLLDSSSFLEKALTPIPLAGNFLSAGFAAVVQVVQKHQTHASNLHRLFLIREELQSIVNMLYFSNILDDVTVRMSIVCHSSASKKMQAQLKTVEWFIISAERLSQKLQNPQISANDSFVTSELRKLSTDISRTSHEFMTCPQDESRRSSQSTIIITGFFFYIVRG